MIARKTLLISLLRYVISVLLLRMSDCKPPLGHTQVDYSNSGSEYLTPPPSPPLHPQSVWQETGWKWKRKVAKPRARKRGVICATRRHQCSGPQQATWSPLRCQRQQQAMVTTWPTGWRNPLRQETVSGTVKTSFLHVQTFWSCLDFSPWCCDEAQSSSICRFCRITQRTLLWLCPLVRVRHLRAVDGGQCCRVGSSGWDLASESNGWWAVL